MQKIIITALTIFQAQFLWGSDSIFIKKHFAIETNFHYGYIVENNKLVPKSRNPFLLEINPSIQTSGSKEWHHIFGFPKIGCSFFLGKLGNEQQLGNIFGILPNLTFNTMSPKWYVPRIKLGLGLAYFNKPFDATNNPDNIYIGSKVTILANASMHIQHSFGNHVKLNAGIAVAHCSNGHYQVPNLGINMPSVFAGLVYYPNILPSSFARKDIKVPQGKFHLNLRTGLGVHVFAGSLEPVGTAKYAIYINDLYVSRRFGKVSNILAGLEVKYYNSFYNYIMETGYYTEKQKMRASVITPFLGHELMIGHLSFITQGGINVYNKFYTDKVYKKDLGFKSFVEKYISTRLGFQYYIFDPKYCTRSNIFFGTYIKANFGKADFVCSQIGFVF